MNKGHKVIVWTAGLLLSAVLFYAGIMAPAAIRAEDRERAATWVAPWNQRHLTEAGTAAAIDRQKRSKSNYYVGAVAPIVLLTGCALLSARR